MASLTRITIYVFESLLDWIEFETDRKHPENHILAIYSKATYETIDPYDFAVEINALHPGVYKIQYQVQIWRDNEWTEP